MSDPHKDDPLPPGWTRQFSKSQGKNFYFHKETKHTQWHFPTASEAKDPLKAKRRADEAKENEKKRGSKDQPPTSENDSSKRPRVATTSSSASQKRSSDDFLELADSTSVAIIVPYRDLHAEQKRSEHMNRFVPHMMSFLEKCRKDGLVSDYHVYIIEQTDDGYKFNRGKLLNIGFDFARKSGRKHDVFIFHDVDLLPQDDLSTWYAKFPKTPIHIARVWGRYSSNPKYIGGVVSFSSSDYKRINGVSKFL
jgi:N-terminal region of glycosyl transferase group 7/WW domain/N-terminal domain of galactosyltransferase